MVTRWNEDKEASTLYGEDVGDESAGDVEIAQIYETSKSWGRSENL
jgi:hypothetical protein